MPLAANLKQSRSERDVEEVTTFCEERALGLKTL